MSGAILLLHLYALVAWTGKALPFAAFVQVLCILYVYGGSSWEGAAGVSAHESRCMAVRCSFGRHVLCAVMLCVQTRSYLWPYVRSAWFQSVRCEGMRFQSLSVYSCSV
jgi:hypothetical protein